MGEFLRQFINIYLIFVSFLKHFYNIFIAKMKYGYKITNLLKSFKIDPSGNKKSKKKFNVISSFSFFFFFFFFRLI